MTNHVFRIKGFYILLMACVLMSAMSMAAQTRSRTKVHVVQAKETVYGLARQYGLSEEDIYALNPSAKQGLREGQTLLIPAKPIKSNSRVSAAALPSEHIIQPQETLYSVSRQYELSEDDLMRANPGISASNFPAGRKLRIPKADSTSMASSPMSVQSETIEVGLMLPLSGNTQRYVEFYEGMLMGLNRLKKRGVSVTLRVYDVSNASDAEDVIHSGELNNCHLLIGGTSNDQIAAISRYADLRGINYVVPFSSGKIAGRASANLFQINPPQEYLYPQVAKLFMQRYADRTVVFVTGSGSVEPCAAFIMSEMDKAGKSYTKISSDTEQGELVKLLRSDSRIVIMPCMARESILRRILYLADGNGKAEQLTFFGYPEWQSFDRDMQGRMRKYGSSFYSSFYFNPANLESEQFLSQYYAWYDHKVSGGFPKYSVLGYDITSYFIGGLASYGRSLRNNLPMLPSTGLQTDFQFREIKGDGGFVNLNLFIVTLRADGGVDRVAISQ
ncbi:peptidoglycan-binding protein LysM [Porphyromonas gulae]|uniref:Peptidoglycan-binding protein LysM n=1 Tax=Porphyromonas gulae TaxID=111105 RepID=A0A0A2GFC3_9PORP|nr:MULTISPECIES: LysM peptidoglycan-binding domain-containing protein [Porphyromonas]KGL54744.1 peptidoglycan-binding protein LysM [Porphyromonas sp. COT-052 OH4946]KGN78652.1 peptidoglycan-binding protein LysM [Porphyromonas gulae]KGN86324.1 peptidoglycan-binding protein LysM [Porphyromonas gulae]KGN89521.1 peptidoglycan-binding protein LysM [Porphyromonas gulae]KGO01969.1 peptidoglycan-binding protein LysM [Porphyromonas gulae]